MRIKKGKKNKKKRIGTFVIGIAAIRAPNQPTLIVARLGIDEQEEVGE